MTHEAAMALSASLVEAGIGHTIGVGIHDELMPPVQCRVDVPIPRRYSGGIGPAINKLEAIADEHKLILGTDMLGNGLTFSTPAHAEGLARRLGGAG